MANWRRDTKRFRVIRFPTTNVWERASEQVFPV